MIGAYYAIRNRVLNDTGRHSQARRAYRTTAAAERLPLSFVLPLRMARCTLYAVHYVLTY